MARLVDAIQHGDKVTIINRFGQQMTGKAVMRSSAGGWVLNMGGAHGTPALASDENTVRVRKSKRNPVRKKMILSNQHFLTWLLIGGGAIYLLWRNKNKI